MRALALRLSVELVVESHAERRVAAGLQHVILVDGVADLERRGRRLAARHARATL